MTAVKASPLVETDLISSLADELPSRYMPSGPRIDPGLCAVCRGRGFCGLSYCPVLARAESVKRLARVRGSREVFGASPPSVFVGRFGYPVVRAGPASPPERGDTSVYDLPEKWVNMGISEILAMRYSLVTGYDRVGVRDVYDPYVVAVQEIALSQRPVDVEMVLLKAPEIRVSFSEYEPPMGPRAPVERVKVVQNPVIPKPLERAYYDTDLRALEAVTYLYRSGVPVTSIQKALSVGALGTGRRRRLVPTRWAITAVDKAVSDALVEEVKQYQELGEVQVFVRRAHGNLFMAVLIPGAWAFEWMEAWWPGSTWNQFGSGVVVEGDWEGFMGRDEYPEIGGCYYASRLAVGEYLSRVRRQATAVLMREIYPGFNLPIGVWFVREQLRAMFREGPIARFSDVREAIRYLLKGSRLGMRWARESVLLRRALTQRRLTDFLGGVGDR